MTKLATKQTAWGRAFAASKRIPNASGPLRKKRIHAWAEFVKQALGKDDGKERAG